MILRWTLRALTALGEIHAHISADNPAAADLLRDRVLAFTETTLSAQPLIGRPGRVYGTRESVIHPSYVLVYRVSGDIIQILTLRHVAQKWPSRF